MPGVAPFELGIAWEGFGVDRSDEGIPTLECVLVSATPEVVTEAGWTVATRHRLDAADNADLADEHSIESLAARSSMSPRTFARRFRDETGTSPHFWLTHQRVLMARRMLESGTDPIDTVAARTGFPTAAMLRHHFGRIVGTSPTSYRRTLNYRLSSSSTPSLDRGRPR